MDAKKENWLLVAAIAMIALVLLFLNTSFGPIAAFFSGIVAAFTPCVVILIPVVLYRFFDKEKKQWKSFMLFVLGFLISYLIFGVVLSELLTSAVQNGIRLGIGILFVVLGILSLIGRLNPLNFPLIKNAGLLGASFALIATINPCTLPYFGWLLSQDGALLNTMLFGLGVLSPALLFAFIGQNLIGFARRRRKFLGSIHKLMAGVLIITGVYMAISLRSFGVYDAYLVGAILAVVFALLLRSFFILRSRKDFNIGTFFLILALLAIIFTTVFHCRAKIGEAHAPTEYELPQEASCTGSPAGCQICRTCASIFGVAASVGLLGIYIARRSS